MKPRPHIELSIDALVLDGLPILPGLREQLTRELADLLSGPESLDGLLAAGPELTIDRIDGGQIDGGFVPGHGGPQLGHSLGRALHRALCGVGPAKETP